MTDAPIIARVIDFETTGEAPPAEVCEAGYVDIDVNARTIGETHAWLCAVAAMPPEVRAVHHISKRDCEAWPPFDPATLVDPGVAAYVAHKADFEAQWFTPPEGVPWICTYKSALRVWPDASTHSNGGLRYWLEDQGLLSLYDGRCRPAHRAGPDAYVTAGLLLALLAAGATGAQMVRWTREPALLPRCPIGKHRGKLWADVDRGFLDWMLRQQDMDDDLKWNARHELDRRDGTLPL